MMILRLHRRWLYHSTDFTSANPKCHDKDPGLMLSLRDRMFGTPRVLEPGEETFRTGSSEGAHQWRVPRNARRQTPLAEPGRPSLRTEVVKTASRMAEIKPAWDALWARGGQSVFQSFGWIDAWWRSRRANDVSRLCIGLCWAGGELVAVMPFASRWHCGVRVLEWAAKDCSDYCDALVDPGFADGWRALGDGWAAVAASGGFDVTYLSHVRPDAMLCNMLGGQRRGVRLKPGHRSARSLQVQCDKPDGHSWFRSLSKKARNNHTRGLRIIGETGPVTVRVSEPSDNVDAVVERMIELKQQWLADTNQDNQILGDDARILHALITELGRQGALRLFSIHCGDLFVAGSVNILSGTRMQAFFAAYDPRFDRASPGTLVMVEYLMWAFDRKFSEVDFLCGEEDYKFRFANKQVDLGTYVGARTPVGRLALSISERLDQRRSAEAKVEIARPSRVAKA